jgi:DNA-binding MarR family transcriptional regulator
MTATDRDERSIFGLGFFLSTLGYRSHAIWAERLIPLGLDSRQAALLLHIAGAEGRSQQALAQAMKIPPSRIVTLVDSLEQRGLVRRRADPADRRVRTLYLTEEGRGMVQRLAVVSDEHEDGLSEGLAPGEREQLIGLLAKVAAGLGLSRTVHAGFDGPEWEPS